MLYGGDHQGGIKIYTREASSLLRVSFFMPKTAL